VPIIDSRDNMPHADDRQYWRSVIEASCSEAVAKVDPKATLHIMLTLRESINFARLSECVFNITTA
jgi:hypothetical protein